MTERPPSLAEQIDAVQHAAVCLDEAMRRRKARPAEIEKRLREINAAIATLKLLEREEQWP